MKPTALHDLLLPHEQEALIAAILGIAIFPHPSWYALLQTVERLSAQWSRGGESIPVRGQDWPAQELGRLITRAHQGDPETFDRLVLNIYRYVETGKAPIRWTQ